MMGNNQTKMINGQIIKANALGWTNMHTLARKGVLFRDIEILALATRDGYTVAHAQAFYGNEVPQECLYWCTVAGYLGGIRKVSVKQCSDISGGLPVIRHNGLD